ncbi:type III secretion system effector XopK [Xanthomonas vasicola]|uniref:type III secretion system effector XopK n=1 Tax=Xanthomonas vasicola TaxID=56459 RepID=UPI0026EEE782|nr:type III secretion system effector XopK [Xanthomonas vasicola]MDO6935123.1 type III secretion system effector XopK [Xanthomonas vasicola]MDO6938345.1 type III secretion system effector XopK [Xanthomonas vasicola]
MRVQRSTAQHLVTRDSAAIETPPASESPQHGQGWPLGLNVLQTRPLPKRTHRDESERRPHHGDANARVAEAEAVYDVFVVAKYLADPLHGTADELAELINDIPRRGEPEQSAEAGEPAHPPAHPPADHAPAPDGHHPPHPPQTAHPAQPHPAHAPHAPTPEGHHAPHDGAGNPADPQAVGHAAKEGVLHVLAEEGAPAGAFDLAMSLGISGAMLPLSSLAIYAAYKETREVAEQRTHLRQRERRLRSEQAALQSALDPAAPADAANAHVHALSEAIDTNAYLQRRNARDGAIAASSMASAGVIFTKAASELGIQGGLAIASKSASAAGLVGHSAAAAGVASAAGIAGSFVLAPLASVAATALGGTFLHQSRRERTRVAVDVGRVERFLQDLEPSELSPGAQRYQHFVSTKLGKYDRFAHRFNQWNKGFVVGGVTYTASTLTKVGVSVAVVAGATVAAPVGTGLIIGAGLLGAATMGVGSHQFLLAHGKQKRYRRYQTEDMPGVDRALLAVADLLPAREAENAAAEEASNLADQLQPTAVDGALTPVAEEAAGSDEDDLIAEVDPGLEPKHRQGVFAAYDAQPAMPELAASTADGSGARAAGNAVPQHGFELRSALYACIDGQEKALDAFLQTGADDLQKLHPAKPRSTDQSKGSGRAAHGAPLGRRVNAALYAAANYGRAVLTGKPQEARGKAMRSHAKHSAVLTETALAQWLQTPGSVKSQIAYMQCSLELQKKYLDAKLSAQADLPQPDVHDDSHPHVDATVDRAPERLLAQLQQARSRDDTQRRAVSLMLQELEMAEQELAGPDARSQARAAARMPGLQQRLIRVLTSNAIVPQEGVAGFARFCMKQARQHTTHLRGTLLATEVQAARIREQAAAAAPASTT